MDAGELEMGPILAWEVAQVIFLPATGPLPRERDMLSPEFDSVDATAEALLGDIFPIVVTGSLVDVEDHHVSYLTGHYDQ